MAQEIINDPNWVLFQGKKSPQPGTVTAHSVLAKIKGAIFAVAVDEVKADWQKVSQQIQQMIDATTSVGSKNFAIDSVEVSLGFTAEGKLVFIAEAGVEATVSVTFKRRSEKAPES